MFTSNPFVLQYYVKRDCTVKARLLRFGIAFHSTGADVQTQTKQGNDDRRTVTVPEAAKLLGISRNAAYEGVKRKEIPSVKIGARIVVPKAALDRMLGDA
jgi:excisionase family DNA binding protein